jgi:putative PIN family toxin of toxin-antitoxin system
VRVTFDTNVFVSALAIPGGRADQALDRVIRGEAHLVISKAIIQELLAVLSKKFGRDREELARVAVFLAELGELVQPRHTVNVLDDEPDNRILECAVAGHADAIVTGDLAMLALAEYEGIGIIRLRDFLR